MKQAQSLDFCVYWSCLSTNRSSSALLRCWAPQITEKPNRKEQLPRTYTPKAEAIFYHLLLFQWIVARLPKLPTITLIWHFDSCRPLHLESTSWIKLKERNVWRASSDGCAIAHYSSLQYNYVQRHASHGCTNPIFVLLCSVQIHRGQKTRW